MQLLSYLFKNSPYLVLLAMVSAFVSGIANASLLAIIHTALRPDGAINRIGFQFMGLAIFSLITAVISSLLLSYLYRRAVFDWQIHLSQEILKTPLRRLESVGNEELLTILLKDVNAIGSSLLPMLPLCTNIVVVGVCMAYLCWLSWQLFIAMFGLMIVGAISHKIVLVRGQATLKRAREEARELYGYFRTMTDGMKELKLHARRRQDFLEKSLKPTAASIQRLFFQWSLFHALTQTWSKFLLLFVIGLILFVFPNIISVNSEILTGYILTLLYIRSMLFAIMGAFPALARANIAFQKVTDLGLNLNVKGEKEPLVLSESSQSQLAADRPLENYQNKKLANDWHSVELVAVTHTYHREREDSDFTLGPINLKMHPGEIIFLVGGNGSGKTTLAKLITGLYIPESGEVRFNGDRVTAKNRERYRQLFSVVFADFQLFNSLLGLESSHEVCSIESKARDYLKRLHLDHKVTIEAGRLSTTDLSRGQRQRLALLTARLEDRPFYIFDEWASNQDPAFKDVFYTQLVPELRKEGKAVLVISHDDRYFHIGDRIIKLDYGQLTPFNHSPAKPDEQAIAKAS